MPRISKSGSTLKQMAYARRVWGANGENRSGIAVDVGYSLHAASSPKDKIESKKGFHNAMTALAKESNEVALSILHEFKSRGVEDFTNKELISALNAIGGAWAKFNPKEDYADKNGKKDNNRLRAVIIHEAERGINEPPVATYDEKPVDDPDDF